LVWAALACLAVLTVAGSARAASYNPSDAFYWSMPGGHSAAAIATSSDGNFVYAADTSARRIVQFSSDGAFVRAWSYKHATPTSVTTDAFGNVYVLYQQTETIVKFSGEGKKVVVLASWSVPFAGSIAATRGGSVFVLTNFLNAVGEYNTTGKSIGGFVANLPGQWFPKPGFDTRYWPQNGYDAAYKTVAKKIAVDPLRQSDRGRRLLPGAVKHRARLLGSRQ
jgi:DNA-binding beta-propeller fold protein YncE